MNTNEDIRNDTSEDVIELGIVSVETKGPGPGMELAGPGVQVLSGIAKE